MTHDLRPRTDFPRNTSFPELAYEWAVENKHEIFTDERGLWALVDRSYIALRAPMDGTPVPTVTVPERDVKRTVTLEQLASVLSEKVGHPISAEVTEQGDVSLRAIVGPNEGSVLVSGEDLEPMADLDSKLWKKHAGRCADMVAVLTNPQPETKPEEPPPTEAAPRTAPLEPEVMAAAGGGTVPVGDELPPVTEGEAPPLGDGQTVDEFKHAREAEPEKKGKRK